MPQPSIFITPEVGTDRFKPACGREALETARRNCTRASLSGRLHVVDTLEANALVSKVCDRNTSKADYNRASDRLGAILLGAAVNLGASTRREVTTPNNRVLAVDTFAENKSVVYILRAGVGFLHGVRNVLPDAPEGFVGVTRDEVSLRPVTYVRKLPETFSGQDVFVLDPMLATGGSLDYTIGEIAALDPKSITAVAMISAPEGIDHVLSHTDPNPDTFRIVTTLVHWGLNQDGFIVPGLGDSGNRNFAMTPA